MKNKRWTRLRRSIETSFFSQTVVLGCLSICPKYNPTDRRRLWEVCGEELLAHISSRVMLVQDSVDV